MFQADDVIADYGSDNDGHYEEIDPVNSADDARGVSADSTSPFTNRTTKNPLMNLGEAQMSVDVDDDYGDELYQFEGNTDVGLF